MQEHRSKCIAAGRNGWPAVCFSLLMISLPASAACHLATEQAQLCQSGIAAAVAYQRQKDQASSAQSEAQAMSALLRKSGCQQAGQADVEATVEAIAHGPIETTAGKVDVVSIRLARQTYWYVARDSLSDDCLSVAAPAKSP